MTNVLPYHVGPTNQFSLEFVTPDREEFADQLATRTTRSGAAFKSREIEIERDDGKTTLYAIYRNDVPESVLDERSLDELETILETDFSPEQVQVLEVIVDLFAGIVDRVESEEGAFVLYKDMAIEKVPAVLEHPDWGNASVAEVGGQLLSRFILSHPMPNANHRTGIGLVERYLRSHRAALTIPDTGEAGIWYEWARPYIHDSKRLLTVRRNTHLFSYAQEFGVDVVRRKNGVDIVLDEYDLDVDSPIQHFSRRHEERSITFVQTILEESNASELATRADPGWESFVAELREDQSGR